MFGSGIAQASLGQLYIDYQSETPWIIGGLLFLYIIFIFAMRMRKGSAGAGASVQPIFNFDRMRRAGLLSEDEYKNIKRKAMTQTAEALAGAEPARPGKSGAQALAMLDAAVETRGLEGTLSPEELAASEIARRRREEIERAQAAGASQFDKYRDKPLDSPPILPAADPEASSKSAGAPEEETFGALDPLAQKPTDSLDVRLKAMYRAGAITEKEYDEMKAAARAKKKS
jgi:hypothetical protein